MSLKCFCISVYVCCVLYEEGSVGGKNFEMLVVVGKLANAYRYRYSS
jgi:hypothetical protein